MNIYLIGYRCTGKTSVGLMLAKRLDREFVDSDMAIVKTHGMTIQHMVMGQGWKAFREREHRVLRQLSSGTGLVVGTGGGVVLRPDNVRLMKETGTVVWMRAGSDTIRDRMHRDGASGRLRPSLTSQGAEEEVAAVLRKREPLYRQAAHLAVDTEGVAVEAVCGRVIEKLRESGIDPGR
jgi:shikimate kinase